MSVLIKLYWGLVGINLCIDVSWQQLGSFPIGLPATTTQSCPTLEDINGVHNNARRLIEERFKLSPSACGGEGWSRVAFLNMSDPNESCPSNWTLTTSPVRGCGRSSSNRFTCDSVVYPVRSQEYSTVCGRTLAYQRGVALGFGAIWDHGHNTTEDAYVSGVSVTRGPAGARQHIWTFTAARNEDNHKYDAHYNCPCTNTNVNWPYQIPVFIGTDYFCETELRGSVNNSVFFYLDDPLWDGKGCGSSSTCCQFNSPPWFLKTLQEPTRDDLEIRLCNYDYSADEDKVISQMEFYVR